MAEQKTGIGRGRGRSIPTQSPNSPAITTATSKTEAPSDPSLSKDSTEPAFISTVPATHVASDRDDETRTSSISSAESILPIAKPSGRGRPILPKAPNPPTVCTSISESQPTSGYGSTSNSVTNVMGSPTSVLSLGNDNDTRAGYNSIESPQPTVSSKSSGRGNPTSVKRNVIPPNPHWSVNDLESKFFSAKRAKKPEETGTIGEQIQLTTNYFKVLGYPTAGLVHLYNIQMLNRKGTEIHLALRRTIYNTWLVRFCEKNPNINRYKIVFDNQSTIISYERPLPGIDEMGICDKFYALARSNKHVEYTIYVKAVGKPLDLASLGKLDQFFHMFSETNSMREDLQSIHQALSIALHEHCSSYASHIFNRIFYSINTYGQYGDWDLGYGKAMWRGFYSCLVFSKGTHRLLMNLDVSHAVFMKKQPFLDFLCDIMLHSPLGKETYRGRREITRAHGEDIIKFLDVDSQKYRSEKDYLLKQCKDLRVQSQDAKKTIIYEITDIGLPADRQQFLWKSNSNKNITVNDYYYEQYKLNLQYPTLPTLKTRNGCYLPMELFDVEPARIKRITDEQRAALCKNSTMKPYEYQKSITNIRNNSRQQCFEDDPFVQAWNLNVDVNMIDIPARILPMPEIIYNDTYRVSTDSVRDVGTWDVKSTKFYEPVNFPNDWGILNMTSLQQWECEEFYAELNIVAKQRGMSCNLPSLYHEIRMNLDNIDASMREISDLMIENRYVKFVIVILPTKTSRESKEAYRNVKKLYELENQLGIVSQMIQESNARKGSKKDRNNWDHSKLSNLLLKINTKLNGINSVLKVNPVIERFFSRGHRIMYVGVDLSHSPPGSVRKISVVAVVASADDIPNRYFKEIYKQERPSSVKHQSRENIVHMKDIMKSLISQYERYRGYPPCTIVIYRDGIGDSEFNTVFENELTATREACRELSPVYTPCLTYIVVSKRHHTRFFPQNGSKNVSAGTVVDSPDITNAIYYDFYLNSHHGPLGTSRPTHYYVLYDDNNLNPNEVQMLTYALCYTYARCTRAVSIPAPVKYADLLALRASYYVDMGGESDRESQSSGSSLRTGIETDIGGSVTSVRIALSTMLDNTCPFFL